MTTTLRIHRLTGILFIVATLAFGAAATLLSATFNWPDILRDDPAYIVTQYREGGTSLTFTWLTVAWTYGLLIVPVILLGQILSADGRSSLASVATTIGVIAVLASVVGFLRWVFVVPNLVDLYFAPDATQASREGVLASFVAQHQYGGALLGEHVGQALSVTWSALVSVAILKSRSMPAWLGYLGFVASGVYLLAQGEVMETAVDGFPVLDIAGLAGSTLWALWLVALGIVLMRTRQRKAVMNAGEADAMTAQKAAGALAVSG